MLNPMRRLPLNWITRNRDLLRQNLSNPRIPYEPSAGAQQRYFRIRCNRIKSALSHRIRDAIAKYPKSAHTMDLVGCSIVELRAHLESQFQPGMSWDNYGLWHIDHIRPCCSFDLTGSEGQRECFQKSNLQPLWALDNIRKGGRWSDKPKSA